ncbi:MAG: 3-methyl-2-oxobutanoate dehydrogenase [Planctomycetes bacterium]|nr:3-methyl-2-oxobutanoate dehydrogenase [Planctomycetota bacterium]
MSAPTELIGILSETGKVPKRRLPDLDGEAFVELYRDMVRIRVFDKRMLALQRQGRIGFYGPVKGQEATIVACARAVGSTDWIVPALREGAIAMMRGLPLEFAVAQLIGNDMDLCKGRQMPCHYTWSKGRYVAMSSVIGTQITHATGLAMAAKYSERDEVVLGFLGDGATSSNDFHSGLNFAAVYSAPVVFVCQNNQWSISVPFSQQTATETVAVKAKAYGMPARRVDGNDVLAVLDVVGRAVGRARGGDGPTLVEAVTYRQLGHSSSDDPTRYRDDAEVKAWLARDPIARYRKFLDVEGLWDDERDTEFVDEVDGEISRVVREAEAAPPLDPRTLTSDVFARTDPRLEEHFREEHP